MALALPGAPHIPMIRFRSYRAKLQATLVMLGIAAIAVAGWQVSSGAGAAMRQVTYDRLAAIRETRSRQIERYFHNVTSHVLALSSDESAIAALEAFRDAWPTVPNASPAETAALRSYYETEFAPRIAPGTPESGTERWFPSDPRIRRLQHLYLAANPKPVGDKSQFLAAPGGGAYGDAHIRFHPTFSGYLNAFGFYDIFLLNASDGRILYTVSKEIDLGVQLTAEPYLDTPLARAFRRAMALQEPEEAVIEDYAPYAPSYFAPAAFFATPVWRAGAKIGVLAIQVSIGEVNRVMTGERNWRQEGLGETGQAYIVGPDRMLRSDFRFEIERPEEFFAQLRSSGVDPAVVDRIRRNRTAILNLRVSDAMIERMDTSPGSVWMAHDTRGVPVLCSHRKLEVPGLGWILIAEIEAAEALAPVRSLQMRILLIGLALALSCLLAAHWLSRTVTRPVLALADSTRKLGSREFGVRIPVDRDDELGQLAAAFNRMAEDLERTTVSKADLEVLARRLITAQEEERTYLARELHDDITQYVAALAIEVGRIARIPGENEDARREGLEGVKRRLAQLSDEIHGLSRRLHPAKLYDLGLVAAIESECRATFELGGPPVDFQYGGDLSSLSEEVQLSLYRIVQESLNNVRRHAGASSAQIRLKRDGPSIHLEVEDDGRGFDRSAPGWRPGLGLASMGERIGLLRGRFSVHSQPGQGARIEADIPLEESNAEA